MKQTLKMRILAMLLAVIMVVGVIPATVFATEAETGTEIEAPTEEPVEEPAEEPVEEPGEEPIEKPIEDSLEELAPIDVTASAPVLTGATTGSPEIVYTTREDDYYKLISKNDYALAPGVMESEIVLNNADGTHRQVAHVVEVDINNSYTKVMPSYHKMADGLQNKDYAVQIMSKQIDYAEANGYGNVVAGMNLSLSWYDSAYYLSHPELASEPLGYVVMDGAYYKNSQGATSGAQTCLVINYDEKDGIARPDNIPKTEIRATSTALTGWEEQVIPANFGFLVKNGVNQFTKDHASDPASRSFVGIKADGSIVMVMNDGRQSPYSAGFNNYEMAEFMLSLGCVYAINGDGGGSSQFLSQRPGEEMKLNCSPSDGAPRETTHGILVISTAPATGEFVRAVITSEDEYYTPGSSVKFTAVGADLVGTATEIPAGAQWKLKDDSFGTIENGLFVSNGKEGVVTAQMIYNDEVVGEDTINIVMPDTLHFAQENMVIPYNKTVDLGLSATYDYKNVVIKSSDVLFTLDNETIGVIDGFNMTTAAEGIENNKAVLTAKIGEVSVVTNITLGKGSEIAYTFEDQNLEGWSIYTNYPQYGPKGPNNKVKDDNGNYWYHGQNERGYLSIVDKSTGMVRNGEYALAVECDFSQLYETGFHALNLRFPKVDVTDALSVGFWIYVPYDARYSDLSINTVLGEVAFGGGSAMELSEGWHYVKLGAPAVADGLYGISINVDERAASPDASGNSYYDHIKAANLDAKFTLYIDDITVDYSTAVEDRENPIFSAPMVLSATGETSAAMTGQTIGYNTVTFEAAVAEDTKQTNATGLDAASAKAYVDGVEVDCTYSAGKITIPGVVLADGFHTVKFAISDKNGNSNWISGDINVAAGSDASTVKVVPQDPNADRLLIGSLYWMDVVATDIETIDKVEMTLDMNNSSQWELEGMTTAEGFSASYKIQEDDNIAKITITRTGKNTETGEKVLASFPVRTWESTITEYEGYEDQTPAKLVSRGIIWKKAIEIELQRGLITFVEGKAPNTTGSFGMEDILVDTEIFFTNYTRASVAGAQDWINAKKAAGIGWHEHTAKAAADVEATCTTAGYIGRTFCEGCNSVVEWGVETSALGHSFDKSVDGVHTCETCAKTFYYVGGEEKTGWQEIDGAVYYFDADGAANGKVTIDGIEYTFVDCKLTAPALVSDGVAQVGYWAGKQLEGGWHTLNGNKYFVVGIYVSTGISKVALSTDLGYRWYAFDENGVWLETYNGLYDDGDEIIYAENGVATYAGLVKDADGNLYYINSSYKAVRNCKYGISAGKANGLVEPGEYVFGADGKMINPPTAEPDEPGTPDNPDNPGNPPVEPDVPAVKQGLVKDDDGEIRFYKDGVAQYAGVVKDDEGNLYYINSTKKAVKNCKYGISAGRANGLVEPGEYSFGADCKMIDPPTVAPDEPDTPDTPDTPDVPAVKQGLVKDEDGELRYYKDGVAQYAGVVKDDEGNLYYINSTKKAVKNCKYGISAGRTNGLVDAGIYEFDAEGKMVR